MGKAGWKETEPVRRVCLDGFRIDRTEVTLAQYEKCVARKRCDAPEYFPEPAVPQELRSYGPEFMILYLPPPYDPEDFWDKESIPGKRQCPVVGITWKDAAQYCSFVGKRLPTGAEWEYAMLGGDSVFKDTALELAAPRGWFAQNSGKKAHPVGRKDPNGLGIYDMLGNVAEYVQDPFPDGNREMHVVRGGSWGTLFGSYMAHWRWNDSVPRSWWVGFRCAESP